MYSNFEPYGKERQLGDSLSVQIFRGERLSEPVTLFVYSSDSEQALENIQNAHFNLTSLRSMSPMFARLIEFGNLVENNEVADAIDLKTNSLFFFYPYYKEEDKIPVKISFLWQLLWAIYIAEIRFNYKFVSPENFEIENLLVTEFGGVTTFKIDGHLFKTGSLFRADIIHNFSLLADKHEYSTLSNLIEDNNEYANNLRELFAANKTFTIFPGTVGYLFHPYFTENSLYTGYNATSRSIFEIPDLYSHQNFSDLIMTQNPDIMKLLICISGMLKLLKRLDQKTTTDKNYSEAVNVLDRTCRYHLMDLELSRQYDDYFVTLSEKFDRPNNFIIIKRSKGELGFKHVLPDKIREQTSITSNDTVRQNDYSKKDYPQDDLIFYHTFSLRGNRWTAKKRKNLILSIFHMMEFAHGLAIMIKQNGKVPDQSWIIAEEYRYKAQYYFQENREIFDFNPTEKAIIDELEQDQINIKDFDQEVLDDDSMDGDEAQDAVEVRKSIPEKLDQLSKTLVNNTVVLPPRFIYTSKGMTNYLLKKYGYEPSESHIDNIKTLEIIVVENPSSIYDLIDNMPEQKAFVLLEELGYSGADFDKNILKDLFKGDFEKYNLEKIPMTIPTMDQAAIYKYVVGFYQYSIDHPHATEGEIEGNMSNQMALIRNFVRFKSPNFYHVRSPSEEQKNKGMNKTQVQVLNNFLDFVAIYNKNIEISPKVRRTVSGLEVVDTNTDQYVWGWKTKDFQKGDPISFQDMIQLEENKEDPLFLLLPANGNVVQAPWLIYKSFQMIDVWTIIFKLTEIGTSKDDWVKIVDKYLRKWENGEEIYQKILDKKDLYTETSLPIEESDRQSWITTIGNALANVVPKIPWTKEVESQPSETIKENFLNNNTIVIEELEECATQFMKHSRTKKFSIGGRDAFIRGLNDICVKKVISYLKRYAKEFSTQQETILKELGTKVGAWNPQKEAWIQNGWTPYIRSSSKVNDLSNTLYIARDSRKTYDVVSMRNLLIAWATFIKVVIYFTSSDKIAETEDLLDNQVYREVLNAFQTVDLKIDAQHIFDSSENDISTLENSNLLIGDEIVMTELEKTEIYYNNKFAEPLVHYAELIGSEIVDKYLKRAILFEIGVLQQKAEGVYIVSTGISFVCDSELGDKFFVGSTDFTTDQQILYDNDTIDRLIQRWVVFAEMIDMIYSGNTSDSKLRIKQAALEKPWRPYQSEYKTMEDNYKYDIDTQ